MALLIYDFKSRKKYYNYWNLDRKAYAIFMWIRFKFLVIVSNLTNTFFGSLNFLFFFHLAVSDYRQSLQFQNLNDEKRNIRLEVCAIQTWACYWNSLVINNEIYQVGLIKIFDIGNKRKQKGWGVNIWSGCWWYCSYKNRWPGRWGLCGCFPCASSSIAYSCSDLDFWICVLDTGWWNSNLWTFPCHWWIKYDWGEQNCELLPICCFHHHCKLPGNWYHAAFSCRFTRIKRHLFCCQDAKLLMVMVQCWWVWNLWFAWAIYAQSSSFLFLII